LQFLVPVVSVTDQIAFKSNGIDLFRTLAEKELPMQRSAMESLRADKEVMDELRSKLKSKKTFRGEEELPHRRRAIVEFVAEPFGAVEGLHDESEASMTEAIILEFGRPSLLIQDNRLAKPASDTWQSRLSPHASAIEKAIPAVGRIELRNHPDFEWVGTGWLIDGRYLITNRHVARLFAEQRGDRFDLRRSPAGLKIEPSVDFREEYKSSEAAEFEIINVVYISPAGDSYPDMAVLKVKEDSRLTSTLTIAASDARNDSLVGVIGYPARDSRNGDAAMQQIFQDIFDVKRFAPGYVTSTTREALQHDASTLGGNSGSPVIDLGTGHVVGLHFGGRFKQTNYAVPASVIKRVLAGTSVQGGLGEGQGDEERRTIKHYEGRKGFRADFLGKTKLRVSLPELNDEQLEDAVEVDADREGMEAYALHYTHFSVIMCKSRKLAFYTAVNIDGSEDLSLKRKQTPWRIDPRIPAEFQCGPDVYVSNRLDRGHLVRRLDPVWGEPDVARLADDDTFHYTNAAPQHDRLNQKTWLSREDYLLSNAASRDLKINVFTGPVFSTSDRDYRGIQIPEEFWKVVTMVTAEGKLHATAYLLSQENYLDDLEFVYGRFKTYQTSIRKIAKKTGLDFGKLPDHDPLGATESLDLMQPINSALDIML
jgi:endonuclease G